MPTFMYANSSVNANLLYENCYYFRLYSTLVCFLYFQPCLVISWSGVTMICIFCRWLMKLTLLSYPTISTNSIGTFSHFIEKSLRKGFVSQYWGYWLLNSTIPLISWATCRIYKSPSPLISLLPGCCAENWVVTIWDFTVL